MAKKPNLTVALQKASGQNPKPVTKTTHTATEHKQPVPPSRKGKKIISGHFDQAVSHQLKQIALDEETSVQELLREAINDLFLKKGSPPIA